MLAAVAQRKVAQAQFAQRSFLIEIFSALLYKDTGKLMEYQRLTKNPKYRLLYRNSYAKEIGRMSQGMTGLAVGTNTFFLLVRPPRSQSLLIMGWCSSIPEHRLRIPLDYGPIYFS